MVPPATNTVCIIDDPRFDKTGDEVIQGISVREYAGLEEIGVERYNNISRIANNVNGTGIAWIEAFMAFENARKGTKFVIGQIDGWYKAVDIAKGHRLMLMNEVPKNKARPRAPRTVIADQKNIIRKNCKSTPGVLFTQSDTTDSSEIVFKFHTDMPRLSPPSF